MTDAEGRVDRFMLRAAACGEPAGTAGLQPASSGFYGLVTLYGVGLLPGQRVRVTVAACNALGCGNASRPLIAHTQPGVPRRVLAAPILAPSSGSSPLCSASLDLPIVVDLPSRVDLALDLGYQIRVDEEGEVEVETPALPRRTPCAGYLRPSSGLLAGGAAETVDCVGNCYTGRGYCYEREGRCANCALWEANALVGEVACSAMGVAEGGPLPGDETWQLGGCPTDLPPPPPPQPPAPPAGPPPPPACSPFAAVHDTDLHGGGVADAPSLVPLGPSATPEECCVACGADPVCAGFVLFEGWCYRKYGGITTFSLGGRTSYLRRPPEPPASPPEAPPPPPDSPPPPQAPTPSNATNATNASRAHAGPAEPPPPPPSAFGHGAPAAPPSSALSANGGGARRISGVLLPNSTRLLVRLPDLSCDIPHLVSARLVNLLGGGPWSAHLWVPARLPRPSTLKDVRVQGATPETLGLSFTYYDLGATSRRRRLSPSLAVAPTSMAVLDLVVDLRPTNGDEGEPVRAPPAALRPRRSARGAPRAALRVQRSASHSRCAADTGLARRTPLPTGTHCGAAQHDSVQHAAVQHE